METATIRYKTTITVPASQAGTKGQVRSLPIAIARKLVEGSSGVFAEYVSEEKSERMTDEIEDHQGSIIGEDSEG